MSRIQESIVELNKGFATAFIDHSLNSNLAYRPEFISNNYRQGRKVLVSIEEELARCEEFCISVAFITKSGLTPLLQILKELENKNIPGKILTTDYLTFSEPAALETLAAVTILRDAFPELKIRVVNVVDLMRLQSAEQHPHGLSQQEYNAIFTADKPIVFAFHGYPSLIHELTYKRTNKNLHVRGYIEEGTITTPFDMRVLNKLDRFNLVQTAVYNLPQLGNRGSYLIQQMKDKLVEHKQFIAKYGVDLPEVAEWKWTDRK